MSDLRDPIAAMTHPRPYRYYERMCKKQPMYRDESLGFWIASSAGAVRDVLTSDLCLVRPPAGSVPAALAGTTAGRIFGLLARFIDGGQHQRTKIAISETLSMIDEAWLNEEAARWATRLFENDPLSCVESRRSTFTFDLSSHVIGSMLRIPDLCLRQLTDWLSDFVRCISPGTNEDNIERGIAAADQIWELFQKATLKAGSFSLRSKLGEELKTDGQSQTDRAIANAIGLLFQAYDATAGLIGGALLAIKNDPEHLRDIEHNPGHVRQVVLDALHLDPPVQNTRRFVGKDGSVAGNQVRAGETILVLLAAANRDPSLLDTSGQHVPAQTMRASFSFGFGAHVCPGQSISFAIAQAAIHELVRRKIVPLFVSGDVTHRASVNVRIPEFRASRRACPYRGRGGV